MGSFCVLDRRPWVREGADVERPAEPEQVEGRAREFFLHIFFLKKSYITLHDSSINYVLLLIWSVFVMTT